MEVDHIVPEHLLKTPHLLRDVLDELGLAADFDLNSYENWLPSCARCNGQKRGRVYKAVPLHLACLDRAIRGAEACRTAELRSVRNADVAKSLNYLERAAGEEEFDFERLRPLVLAYAKANPSAMRALLEEDDNLTIGFATNLPAPAPEFAITPFYKILYRGSGAVEIVQTPRGTGYVPTDPNPHHSFYCGHCGSKGPWNGARCLSCGMLDDGE